MSNYRTYSRLKAGTEEEHIALYTNTNECYIFAFYHMVSREILVRQPNPTPATITEISCAHEQQMFKLLQSALPTSKIGYESHRFVVIDDEGKERSTIPDFTIEKPDGSIIHLEVTTMELNGTDPKARQREVMQQFPEERYVVLYGQHLYNIQERRGIPLIGARKIKKDKHHISFK